MINKYFIYGLVLFILSCNNENTVENAAARVYDSYLSEDEIQEKMPESISREDSILFRNNFINAWATKELLLHKARINVNDENNEINELVANYRKELLIDKYKQAVLQQELDTLITEQNLEEFYEKNKSIYRLNEELVQIKYIHFSKDLNDKKELISLFKSKKEEDLEQLKNKELEFNSYNFNDSIWVSLNLVKEKLPFLSEEQKIKKIDFFQKEDSLGVYLVAVKNVLFQNEIAPKSYVIPTIKQMILHNRKLELMKTIEKTIVNDAISNKQFEQYKND